MGTPGGGDKGIGEKMADLGAFAAGIVAGLAALAVQGALWRRLRPARLVGDEAGYLAPPKRPEDGALYVRVPLHNLLMRAAAVWPSTDAWPARVLVGLAAAGAVGVSVATLAAHGAVGMAGVAALLMLCSTERAVLALHLWPDHVMGLCWAGFAALLVAPAGPDPVALALVAGTALGVRIEGAALFGAAVLSPWVLASDPWGSALAAVICIGAAVLWTLANRVALGLWQLDTTTAFNLRVWRRDARLGSPHIGSVMRDTIDATIAGDVRPSRPRLRDVPVRWAARMRLLLGPETFVSERLLAEGVARYAAPDLLTRAGPVRASLRYGFTALAALALIGLPHAPAPLIALTVLGLVTYGALVTRSRYRVILMPVLAISGGLGWQAMLGSGRWVEVLPGLSLVALMAMILAMAPRLTEAPGS